MVRQRRIRGAASIAACLGALALCTAASFPPEAPPPSGGAQAPEPAAGPTPPSGAGGAGAPEPEDSGPVAPPLEPAVADAQAEVTQEPQEPPEAQPDQVPPLEEESEEEFEIEVPRERDPRPQSRTRDDRTPMIPTLRPMPALEPAVEPAAARLAQTGVDARLLGAAGTFLIGLGMAMLSFTLPPRRL